MKQIRQSSREEVVSYYIASELKRFLERADKQPSLDPKIIRAFSELANTNEGTLQHMSRALLDVWREHSWLHQQFWSQPPLAWSLVEVQPAEIDVMPLGGKPEEFHYPKLDVLVQQLQAAASRGERVAGIEDDPKSLLTLRPLPPLQNRIILINGEHENRHCDCVIGDGVHRAISMAAMNLLPLVGYYGVPHNDAAAKI